VNVVGLPRDLSVQEAVREYAGSPSVAYAEPNLKLRPAAAPNDPGYDQLWGLNNTGQTGGTADSDADAPEAWGTTTGSPQTVVAVVDEGIDVGHPDLRDNVWTNSGEIADNRVDDDDATVYDPDPIYRARTTSTARTWPEPSRPLATTAVALPASTGTRKSPPSSFSAPTAVTPPTRSRPSTTLWRKAWTPPTTPGAAAGARPLSTPRRGPKRTDRSSSPRPTTTSHRTPRVLATVSDNASDMQKADIRLFLDGERQTEFDYDADRNRLGYAVPRLAYGAHGVRIVAADRAGNVATYKWGFKVVH
jgi:subtilisin family serine protease